MADRKARSLIFKTQRGANLSEIRATIEAETENNSPSQDSNHPEDLFQSRYDTPGFKPFSYLRK